MQEIRTKILVELHLHFFSWEYHELWYSHSVHFKASSLQFFQKSSNLVDIKYHVYFINQEIFSHLYVFSALDSITFTCKWESESFSLKSSIFKISFKAKSEKCIKCHTNVPLESPPLKSLLS